MKNIEKVELLKEIELHEKVVIELSKWSPGFKFSKEVKDLVGEIKDSERRDTLLEYTKRIIASAKKKKLSDDNKLYLSEIIKRDKVVFRSNNLILSPVGSGKTEFIKSLIEENDKVLLLVSTTSLKDKMVPLDEKIRRLNGDRMYSTKNKKIYGKGTHKVLVMTYAELGERMKFQSGYLDEFDKIFCDEIHSLPLYQSYTDSSSLLVVMHFLFLKSKDSQQKFYLTATDEHIKELSKKSNLLKDVKIFNYLKDKEIKRHIPLSSYEINGLEQVKPHLKARKESFEYFNYKIFAFCKTIKSQENLKTICEEEGFTVQMYWSKNNEEKPMTAQQIEECDKMLQEEKLPDAYDVVIINSALQEGWNLKDDRVKLAIINTTNETEYVQSIGRIRNDLDILIYRAEEKSEPEIYIDFPQELIGQPLDTEMKEELRKKFNILTYRGEPIGWTKIKSILKNQGFTIVSKQITVDKKRKRVDYVLSK